MSRVSDLRARAESLLAGSYDLHTHATPSHFPRLLDDFELLREADRYKMRGLMFKCHYEPTVSRALIANLHAGAEARAYGSVALNWPVGGLNPYAAESALKLGAKMVWLPTLDTRQFIDSGEPFDPSFRPRPGLTVLDGAGRLLPVLHDLFEVVKEFDSWLATGHLSARESLAVCQAGREAGVKMILTHPDFKRTPVPLDLQLEAAARGVLVEKVWLNVKQGDLSARAFADSIKKLGVGACFMTTDRGQATGESPAEAMLEAAETMLACGLTPADVTSLIKTVPEQIVS